MEIPIYLKSNIKRSKSQSVNYQSSKTRWELFQLFSLMSDKDKSENSVREHICISLSHIWGLWGLSQWTRWLGHSVTELSPSPDTLIQEGPFNDHWYRIFKLSLTRLNAGGLVKPKPVRQQLYSIHFPLNWMHTSCGASQLFRGWTEIWGWHVTRMWWGPCEVISPITRG